MPSVKLNDSLVPTDQEVILARESQRQLDDLDLGEEIEPVDLHIRNLSLALPAGIARVTLGLIRQVARGNAVAVVPLENEVSPQEAASLLNVSRTFATKLFEEGAIPSRKIGTHWRANVRDVLAWKEENKKARRAVLKELVAESQRLGLE